MRTTTISGDSDGAHTVNKATASAWAQKALLLSVLYRTRKRQDPDWTPAGGMKTSSQDLLRKNDFRLMEIEQEDF